MQYTASHALVITVIDLELSEFEVISNSSYKLPMTSSVTSDWGSLILHEVRTTGNEIGRGAYGRVFEVDYEGTLCAAKEVHAMLLQFAQGDDLNKIEDDFLSECQIWSTLRHPCVVQFLGTVVLV